VISEFVLSTIDPFPIIIVWLWLTSLINWMMHLFKKLFWFLPSPLILLQHDCCADMVIQNAQINLTLLPILVKHQAQAIIPSSLTGAIQRGGTPPPPQFCPGSREEEEDQSASFRNLDLPLFTPVMEMAHLGP
jgi:hypothetical protein